MSSKRRVGWVGRKDLILAACALLVGFLLPPSALSQGEEDLRERYLNLLRLTGEEQYEEAFDQFQQFLYEHPDYHRAYGHLVRTYIFLGRLSEAQVYFETLITDDPDNAYAYYGLARIQNEQGKLDEAIHNLKRCIALDPTFAEAYGRNGGLSEIYREKNESEEARLFFEELLQRDPRNAAALYGLACSYIDDYDWDRALDALAESIDIDGNLTVAYRELIYAHGVTGQFRKAQDASQALREVAGNIDDWESIAYADSTMGNVYLALGDYWQSLRYYDQALKLARENGDKFREGLTLNNIATLYGTLGDHDRALDYFGEAREFAKKFGDEMGEIIALNNLAMAHGEQGHREEALEFCAEALKLAREGRFKREEVLVLNNLAMEYQDMGEVERAFEEFEVALNLAREIDDRAWEGILLVNLGIDAGILGEYDLASRYIQEGLDIATEIEDTKTVWQAHIELGMTFEKQGETERALSQYARAIELYDTVREGLGIESLANHFLEYENEVYPAIVRVLAQMKRYDEAFGYAQQYKAKSLLEILSGGRAVIEELLPESLRTELQEIGYELEATHEELALEHSEAEPDGDRIVTLDHKITDLELRKAAFVERIENEYPEFYQLTSSESLDVEAVQSRVLAPEQTLVEYVVGKEQLSIFVVTSDTLTYRSVDVSQDKLARMLADLSVLFDKDKTSDKESGQKILSPQLADFSIPPARALYDVLIAPVEAYIRDGTELIIAPDDVLFYLPFEILVAESNEAETAYDFENATFLLQKYAVSYAPSASVLATRLLRQTAAEGTLLAFGNPDFGGREEDEASVELMASTMPYAGGLVRGGRLIPLPNSENEVEAIGGLLRGTEGLVYTGQRATEEAFKQEGSRFRILHFATHFLVDDRQPLYSKIVLARDEEARQDGYLQTYEIFNTKLNADLVVLSACNTGLGKLSKGEGLLGMSRAFWYAGVPSLVVSLWSVDDEATSVIMESFYRYLGKGANKKEALRRAKLDYLEVARGDKKDPFYWAPFILMGDWEPLAFPVSSRWTGLVGIAGLGLALLIVTLVIISRRRTAGKNL